LTNPYTVWYGLTMNDVQKALAGLQDRGWTLAALADELGVTVNAVEKWKAGQRYPANAKAILALLDWIGAKKRVPKQRRYDKAEKAKGLSIGT